MLLNDTSPELLALIIGNSFERELASAWVTRDATSLSNILGRVTAQIAREEVEGGTRANSGWLDIYPAKASPCGLRQQQQNLMDQPAIRETIGRIRSAWEANSLRCESTQSELASVNDSIANVKAEISSLANDRR